MTPQSHANENVSYTEMKKGVREIEIKLSLSWSLWTKTLDWLLGKD